MSDLILVWPEDSDYPVSFDAETFHNPSAQNEFTVWSRGYIANRAELIAQHNLSDQITDKEVLVALYTKIGAKRTAEALSGTCSWLVWDAEHKKLVFVSDHIGLEPIYFLQQPGCLWVASNAELIFRQSGLPRRLNPVAVVARLSGLPSSEGQTLFENISVLPPATVWTYTKERSGQTCYWQPEIQSTLRLKNDDEYAEALRGLLVKIVDEHIPQNGFALTLSAGMDSSSIAGALRLARPKDHIPCIGWTMPEFDSINEEAWIRATSNRLGLDLITIQTDQYWTFKPLELATQLSYQVAYQEAWIATYQKMNERGLRVLTSGVPGDLCFGDFISCYPDLLLGFQWGKLIAQIREELKHGYHKHPDWKTPLRLVLKPLFHYLNGGQTAPKRMAPAWLHTSKLGIYEQVRRANRPPRKFGLPARIERWRGFHHLGNPQNLIRYSVLASHFGIELRHPLYDHRIVEFALSLPADQTYRAGTQKYILRNSMRGILPDEVVNLRQKILPIRLHHRGLRERSIEQVKDLMTGMRLAEMRYILPEAIECAYNRYLEKKTDESDFILALTLESQVRAWN